MMGKVYERGRSWAGSKRERELWIVRVASWHSEKMWQGAWTGKRDRGTGMKLTERTKKLLPETWWGMPIKERSVIRKAVNCLSVCSYDYKLRQSTGRSNWFHWGLGCLKCSYGPVCMYHSGRGPAYSGPICWGLDIAGHCASPGWEGSGWWCVRVYAWLKGEEGWVGINSLSGIYSALLLGMAYCLA